MVKFIRIVTIVLLFFLSVSAIYGGGALILEPSSKLLQMPLSLLEHSPFDTFLIPGIILFLFNGISSLVIAVMTIKKLPLYTLLTISQGIVQVIWIIIQIAMIRTTSYLHFIYFAVGVLLVITGMFLRRKAKNKEP